MKPCLWDDKEDEARILGLPSPAGRRRRAEELERKAKRKKARKRKVKK